MIKIKYINKLQNYPIAISGTCLAFITLSNSWLIKDIGFVKPLAIAIAIGMLILMILKAIIFPKKFFTEMKDPVLGTFYPTIGMTTWLVVDYFYKWFPHICAGIWLLGVAWHYGIIILYTILRIKERKFKNIMPTCFVVYTGMITGSIAGAHMAGMEPIAKFLLLFGFTMYTLLLPLVLFIVFRSEKLEDHRLPTVGIICSPAPLGVVGMLTVYKQPNEIMLWWLIITGLLLLPVVYSYILRLFKDGFKPTHAAFTFPLAIATLAAFKLSAYFGHEGHAFLSSAFELLGNIEIFIATYVVGLVLINFLVRFVNAINPALERKLAMEAALLDTVIEEEDYSDDEIIEAEKEAEARIEK